MVMYPPCDGGETLEVRPFYYGMLLFAQAAPGQSQLLPVQTTSAANIKAWATRDEHGTIRVLLLNKDLEAAGQVSVQLATSSTAATVAYLQAPALDATSGITLGGQTFDGTADGHARGQQQTVAVAPRNGAYLVDLPHASAALLTITLE